MFKVAENLAKHTSNGVISLAKVDKTHPLLVKLYFLNRSRLNEILFFRYKLNVLDDLHPIKEPEQLRLYLKYTYGDSINMTDLLKNNWKIYHYIRLISPVYSFLKSNGFKIVYDKKLRFIQTLEQMYNSQGYIAIPERKDKLYKDIWYFSRKKDMSIKEYLEYLGFYVRDLKEETRKMAYILYTEGFSKNKIAKDLNVSITFVTRAISISSLDKMR